MGKAMPPHERAALKAAIRGAVEELLAGGHEPTEYRLRRRFPRRGRHTLAFIRDELAEEGLIDWEPTEPTERGYLPDSREIRKRAIRVRFGLPLPEETRPQNQETLPCSPLSCK